MTDMETKAFVGGLEVKDAARGEVVAIVATLGVVDRDGDVLLPGCFPRAAKVKLSGYGHDIVLAGSAPVGKGTISEEAHQAVFRGSFFLSTERGREAFFTTKELGLDSEWSFSFPNDATRTAELTEAWRAKRAQRLIAGLTPIEASPVFRGAGISTGTLSVRSQSAGVMRLTAAERHDLKLRENLRQLLREPGGLTAVAIAARATELLAWGAMKQRPPLVSFFDGGHDGAAGFFSVSTPDHIHIRRGLTLEELVAVVGHETSHYLAPWARDEPTAESDAQLVVDHYFRGERLA